MLDIITEQELAENGVVSAPDKLTGDPEENKRVFDRLITAVLAPHINRVVRAYNELETALRDHIDIDPTSVRDNNVSVTEEVITALELEGLNPTVKDALLAQNENMGELGTVLHGLIGERAQIVHGEVTGSSIASEDSPNNITFPFKPKLVYVTRGARSPYSAYSSMKFDCFLWVEGVTKDAIANTNYGAKYRYYKLDGNTLSWWVDQGSSADTTYQSAVTGNYIAIG